MSAPAITPTASTTNMEVGPDNIPIPSTLSGKNVNETYLALKTPSPITINSTTPTQLPVSPGPVTIQNPLGNPLIAIGGLVGVNDQPYFIVGQTGMAKGTIIQPGSSATFQVTDSSLLSAISQRDNTIIMVTGNLSQQNYTTQISDPAPDINSLPPFAVVSTVPANNATNVSTSQVIEAVFNRQIGLVSVSLEDIALVPNVPTLQVYIDPTNSSQLDIDPKGSNLAPGTQYTVTLSDTIPDVTDINGTAMLAPYSFVFTVGIPPPLNVSSVTPGNAATGIATTTAVVVVMSQAMQTSPVNTSNVQLVAVGGATVTSTVSLASDQLTITITPSSNLSFGTQYKVVLQNLISAQGVELTPNPYDGVTQGPFAGTFTTFSALTVNTVTPGNATTGVATNTTVVVVMSTTVASAGVTTSNVQLVQVGGSAVTSTVALGSDKMTITITPTSALSFSTQYKVVVQNLVSLQGVNQSPSPWDGVSQGNAGTFTTSSTATVNTVVPGNNAINVPANTTIAVLMSTTIKSALVTTGNIELIKVSGGTVITCTVALGGDQETITITPSATLLASTQYKVVVQNQQTLTSNTQVPNPWDGATQGPGAGEFTTSAPPTVSNVTPGSAATGVAVNTTIAVVMSQTMASGGVTTSNVKLIKVSGGTTVTSTVALGVDQQTITITPSASLTASTEYKVTVQSLVGTDGITMSPSPWDGVTVGPNSGAFTTIAPPTVSTVSPGSAATGVAIAATISVVMTQTMASGGVTTSNVKLINVGTGATVTTTVSLGSDQQTITITPTTSLAYNTEYKVTIQNLVGTNGVTMSPSPWDGVTVGPNSGAFTTVVQPTVVSVTPGNNATGVAITTSIVVVMSEPILSGGVTTSNIELFLASNNTIVPASVSLAADNETITISPTSALAYSTQYYVVVQNLASVAGSITQTPNPYDPFTTGSLSSIYNIAKDTSTEPSCSPSTGAGYFCYVNTSGYYAAGETATASNGLIGAVVQKVIVASVKTQTGGSGNVGIQIVKANATVAYTFSSTVSVSSSSGTSNVTITDMANTYVMQSGDGVFVTWSVNSSNSLAISMSGSSGFSTKGAAAYNGTTITIGNASGLDLAAQIFAASSGGANAFTTGALSYTQIYNVSGNSSPCATSGAGFGPSVPASLFCSGTSGKIGLGTGSGFDGVSGLSNVHSFGEIASSANGLVGQIVNKVVLPTVIGDNDEYQGSGNTAPTGNIGIQIVSSAGVVKYTFSSTFAASSTGYNSICTISCGGSGGTVFGWTNITLIDTGNTYVMTTGDAVMVTWSGTGNNVILPLQNSSNVYGKACYQTSSGSSTTAISSVDLAATIYTV
jgi:Bacterial Ig-like domain